MLRPGTPVTNINKGANGAVTATQTSPKINAGNYGTVKLFLTVSAISGTSPSLTVKLQDSADNVNWTDVTSGAMTAVTATGSSSLAVSNVGTYLRAVQTVAGTTPSITYDLNIVGVA